MVAERFLANRVVWTVWSGSKTTDKCWNWRACYRLQARTVVIRGWHLRDKAVRRWALFSVHAQSISGYNLFAYRRCLFIAFFRSMFHVANDAVFSLLGSDRARFRFRSKKKWLSTAGELLICLWTAFGLGHYHTLAATLGFLNVFFCSTAFCLWAWACKACKLFLHSCCLHSKLVTCTLYFSIWFICTYFCTRYSAMRKMHILNF